MNKVKFSKPNILPDDINLVKKIIKSGWLTHGKYTNLFEKKFNVYTNSKYAITVSSCTAALHLSCLASGFKKGDEIIVPSMSHTATAHAVEYTGAKVVFSEIDKLTGNITLDHIKKKISKKTKGIIIVHMAGFPCEVDKISKFCKKNKIILIEDCAHALGTFIKRKHAGNYGISGCFSFYPTKQITTGEGGILITNDLHFFQKVKKLKAFGIDKDIKDRKKPGDYDVKALGYNYRMTDIQAALANSQIKRLSKIVKRRHEIADIYNKELKNLPVKLPWQDPKTYTSFHLYVIRLKLNEIDISHEEFFTKMRKAEILVNLHYIPVYFHPYYRRLGFKKGYCEEAEKYYSDAVSIPMFPSLKDEDQMKVIKTIKSII